MAHTGQYREVIKTEQFAVGEDVAAYLQHLQQEQGGLRVSGILRGIAKAVQPTDGSVGVEGNQPYEAAFLAGSILGVRAISACVDNVDAIFVKGGMPDGRPYKATVPAYSDVAAALMEMGNRGYAQVSDIFEPLFDEWDVRIVPDVTKHAYFRSGFGMPFAFLQARINHNRQLERMAQEAEIVAVTSDPNFNWDALLY